MSFAAHGLDTAVELGTTVELGIVVGVDGSPHTSEVVTWAAHEALMRGIPVTLAHVISPVPVSMHDLRIRHRIARWRTSRATRIVTEARNLVESVGATDPPEVRTELFFDHPVPALTRLSKDAHLVVVGRGRRDPLTRHLPGSVSTGLCHHAHCPVAVIPERDAGSADVAGGVLVGIDGSPASESATAIAFDEASRRGVELTALHAWSDAAVFPAIGEDWHTCRTEADELLAERLAGWQERYPDVRIERRIVCDRPAHHLLESARHAQLVVVGSHGRGGFAGMLLGSVSTAVAQSVDVPVIVARPR